MSLKIPLPEWTTRQVDEAVKEAIRQGFSQCKLILAALGDPDQEHVRIVDRSLQRLRKTKVIRFVDRRWVLA